MGSYQKADGITLSQLNNTEYTNFMNRVLTLLTAGSISKLTVTNIVNSIKPKLVQMEDLVNRSTANAETKDLLKLDAERDSYVSYLLATVRAAKNSPLAAQRDAYNTLEITVRPYTGLARMRNMEETAAISGLLLDFRKEADRRARQEHHAAGRHVQHRGSRENRRYGTQFGCHINGTRNRQ